MKKLSLVGLLALAMVMISCSAAQNSIGGAYLTPLPVDYEILAETSAEASATAIFFIDFEHLFYGEGGQVTSPTNPVMGFVGAVGELLPSLERSVKNAAMYKALEKIPEADRLLEPRYHVESSGFWPFFVTVNVKLTAKAIKYTKSSPYVILQNQ